MFANELVESEKFSETDGGKEVVEKAGGTGVQKEEQNKRQQ